MDNINDIAVEDQDTDTTETSNNVALVAIAAIGVLTTVAVGGFAWRKFQEFKASREEAPISQLEEA